MTYSGDTLQRTGYGSEYLQQPAYQMGHPGYRQTAARQIDPRSNPGQLYHASRPNNTGGLNTETYGNHGVATGYGTQGDNQWVTMGDGNRLTSLGLNAAQGFKSTAAVIGGQNVHQGIGTDFVAHGDQNVLLWKAANANDETDRNMDVYGSGNIVWALGGVGVRHNTFKIAGDQNQFRYVGGEKTNLVDIRGNGNVGGIVGGAGDDNFYLTGRGNELVINGGGGDDGMTLPGLAAEWQRRHQNGIDYLWHIGDQNTIMAQGIARFVDANGDLVTVTTEPDIVTEEPPLIAA